MDNPVQVPVQLGTSVFTKALSLLRSIEKSTKDKNSKAVEVSAESQKST